MTHITLTVLFVVVLYSLPGIAFAHLLWEGRASKTEKIIFGSVIGLAFSCYISVISAYFFGWNPGSIIISILIFTAVGLGLNRKFLHTGSIHGLSAWKKGEIIACIGCICFVSAFLAITFSRVGVDTQLGYRYSWLFSHDFINKAINAVSLTHGVPTPHFFFAGETLRYYILSYSISALTYSILGVEYSIHKIVIVVSFLQAILFIFVFIEFLKTWFKQTTIYLLLPLSFLLYSYSGIFVLMRDYLASLGITSSFINSSGVSHLFYRFFLVEPQTVMGLMVFFIVISLMIRDEYGDNILPILTVGFLIGIEFGIEAVLGMFLVIAYGLLFLYRFIVGRLGWKKFVIIALGAAFPTIIIYLTYLGTGVYSISGASQGLECSLNAITLLWFLPLSLVSYGPALFTGVCGIVVLLKNKTKQKADAILIIFVFVTFFMITVSHADCLIFGYLKGEKIFFIALLVLSGFFFDYVINSQKQIMKSVLIVLLFISLPALSSPFTDCYLISLKDELGVIYVNHSDMKACDWIKKNLPKNSIVQSEPEYPGTKYAYSLIANFAERRMALGEWKASSIKHDKGRSEVPIRSHDIKDTLFKTLSISESYRTALRYKINYIYIGPLERKIYPAKSIMKWKHDNNFFEEVYNKEGVTIYKVL